MLKFVINLLINSTTRHLKYSYFTILTNLLYICIYVYMNIYRYIDIDIYILYI